MRRLCTRASLWLATGVFAQKGELVVSDFLSHRQETSEMWKKEMRRLDSRDEDEDDIEEKRQEIADKRKAAQERATNIKLTHKDEHDKDKPPHKKQHIALIVAIGMILLSCLACGICLGMWIMKVRMRQQQQQLAQMHDTLPLGAVIGKPVDEGMAQTLPPLQPPSQAHFVTGTAAPQDAKLGGSEPPEQATWRNIEDGWVTVECRGGVPLLRTPDGEWVRHDRLEVPTSRPELCEWFQEACLRESGDASFGEHNVRAVRFGVPYQAQVRSEAVPELWRLCSQSWAEMKKAFRQPHNYGGTSAPRLVWDTKAKTSRSPAPSSDDEGTCASSAATTCGASSGDRREAAASSATGSSEASTVDDEDLEDAPPWQLVVKNTFFDVEKPGGRCEKRSMSV